MSPLSLNSKIRAVMSRSHIRNCLQSQELCYNVYLCFDAPLARSGTVTFYPDLKHNTVVDKQYAKLIHIIDATGNITSSIN